MPDSSPDSQKDPKESKGDARPNKKKKIIRRRVKKRKATSEGENQAPKKKKKLIRRRVKKKKEPEADEKEEKKEEKKERYKPISDEEYEKDIARYHEIYEMLREKLEKLYQSSGVTHKKVQEYLDSPENFDSNEWRSIQRHRKTITENLMRQIDPNYKQTKKRKTSKRAQRKLRGKAMGKRKKWLDIDK